MTHQDELITQSVHHSRHHRTVVDALGHLVEQLTLPLSAAKEEDAARGMTLYETADDLFHHAQWIRLTLVGGEGRNADPLLERFLLADGLGQQPQTRLLGREQRGEGVGDGIAQFAEYLGVVVNRRLYRFQHLVLVLRQPLALGAVLIDVRHLELIEVEPQPQVVRPQHIVQVGDGREVLGQQSAVECVQAFDAPVFALDVGFHKAHVRRQVLKERTRKRPRQHRDAQVRVLRGQRINHRNGHGDIADGREADDENMLSFHAFLCLLLYKIGLVLGSLYIFICR